MAIEADSSKGQNPQFLQRVGSLPLVQTALGQLATIYLQTKGSHRYIKYTLETAEAGVQTVTHNAVPLVANRLERPIGAINSVACSQLDQLEKKFPLIAKPTEEVVGETKKVYDATLKPTVDRVTGITYTSINKVGAAKQYTVDTISATKQYTVDTVNSVKDYTTDTVTGVKNYTYNTVAATASYGKGKLDSALETRPGQAVISRVDQLLEKTDQYVDYYLPEKEKEGEKTSEESEDTGPADNKPTDVTFSKLVSISDKVRRRMSGKSQKIAENILSDASPAGSEETIEPTSAKKAD